MTDYRKGSMGAADQKNQRIAKIVFTGIIVIIALMTHIGLFGTYLHDYEQRASTFANIAGFILYILAIGFLWLGDQFFETDKGGFLFPVIAFGLFALGVCTSCGFNFDLHGIEPGV